MKMIGTLVRVVALTLAMLAPATPGRAADAVTVGTVGSASANLWPVYIGITKGFFTAEDLKIEIVYVQSSANLIQQLTASSLDITMSTGLVDPIRAIDQGAGIAIVRFEAQAPPYALMAKPGIAGLKDLKGKLISLGGAKDITRIYVERMLAPHGVKPANSTWCSRGRPRRAPRRCSPARWTRRSCCRRSTSRRRPRGSAASA
jgi:NitT/TauT family transport system substrate-binding protein